MRVLEGLRVFVAAFAALALAGGVESCGKAADPDEDLQIDSNTNWLMRCETDDQCSGSLQCFCGQCSQPCSQTDECGMLEGAQCSPSGDGACDGRATSGGLCVLACTGDDQCGADFSCSAGQCVPRPCAVNIQTWDDVLAMIASDLAAQDSADTLSLRYVSLANHYAETSCGATMTAERQALFKLVNSLSRAASIVVPVQVDAGETLYRIDLRDYEWDQPTVIGGQYFTDVWEGLAANNPYAVTFTGDDADDAIIDSGTTVPVMFANSLVALATQPDVYAAILGLPDTEDDLFVELGLQAPSAEEPIPPDLRAGFIDATDVVASHWQTQTWVGYLWQIADFGRADGALLEDPLEPPRGDRGYIFTLPNGLPAYTYTALNGSRLDASASFLDTFENDFRARAPRSFLRQHAPLPNLRDEVNDYLQSNPGAFNDETATVIRAAFPGQAALTQQLESDYALFTIRALASARVDPRLPEPISRAFLEFDSDVQLEDAAGDLMLSPGELLDNLNLLDPALGVLDGGGMDRDDFTLFFRQSTCVLTAVNENLPTDDFCQGL